MLLRYDPFREFDRATERFFGSRSGTTSWMPMNAVRRGDHVEVSFDLPGVSPDAIDLTVERGVLTVKAERHQVATEADEVIARERPEGTFSRQVLLGDALDPAGVEASYDAGVLTVKLPVAEKAKPQKVPIAAGDKAAIEV